MVLNKMKIIVLFALVALGSYGMIANNSILFLFGPNTPSSLINLLSDFPIKVSIDQNDDSSIQDALQKYDFSLIIDISFQPSLYILIDSIASSFNTIYFTLNPPNEYYSPWRFYLHNSATQQSKAIKLSILNLKVESFVILSSINKLNLQIADSLYEKSKNNVLSYLKYSENLSQIVSDGIIAKMVKANGYKSIVGIDQEDSWVKIQTSIQNKNMNRPGTFIISSSKSIYNTTIEGSLIVVESGLEFSSCLESYELGAIKKGISAINSALLSKQYLEFDLNAIKTVSLELFPNHTPIPLYSLVNIINNQKVIIGKIENDVNITDPIYYVGNTTNRFSFDKTKIVLSIANGTHELYNLGQFTVFSYQYQAAIYSAQRSNSLNEIPGFEITFFPTDCGIFYYNSSIFMDYFTSIADNMGVAYLSYPWAAPAYGALITFQKLNKYLPQISYFSEYNQLDNKTEFPEFLKLSAPNFDYYTSTILFFTTLSFTDVVILQSNDPGFQSYYDDLIYYLNISGIKVVNPPDKRLLPANYTKDKFDEYKSYFQAAKDTNCRVYIIANQDRLAIYQGLYDIGLRKGDVIGFIQASALQIYSSLDPEDALKVGEFMPGSLVSSFREWVGDLGQELETELSKMYQSLLYMCLAYDEVSIVKEAIIYMLARGQDYEDLELLSSTMRNNKIISCLGNVYFDPESNSRGSVQFSYHQFNQNSSTGDLYFNEVAIIDRFSNHIINFIGELQWPTSTSIPTNYRPYNPCPFDTYLVIESSKGKLALVIISLSFFLVAIVAGYRSQVQFGHFFKELNEKQVVSLSDIMFNCYFFFQFCQLLSLGPSQNSLKYLIKNYHYLIGLDFIRYFNLYFDDFWVLICCLFVYSFIWSIICSLVVLLNGYPVKRSILLKDSIFPILGHIGFIPVFSELMNIYLCGQGIDNNLTDSFMDYDCTLFCYTGKHLIIVLIGGIFILLYLITGIYLRPVWEFLQSSLHICTKSSYLSILSLFQILAVILSKILSYCSETTQGLALCGLIFAMIVYTAFSDPYNLKSAKILQIMSLSAAFWGILTACIFNNIGSLKVWWIVEFVGFILISLTGTVIICRYPILISDGKGMRVEILFLFQFTTDIGMLQRIKYKINTLRESVYTKEMASVKAKNILRSNTKNFVVNLPKN
jgi:hypothetical protein